MRITKNNKVQLMPTGTYKGELSNFNLDMMILKCCSTPVISVNA